MAFSLIATKYCLPPPGLALVERPRLLQKLAAGLSQGRRVILVCAPAGYGKTTLVADWANRLARHPPGTASDLYKGQAQPCVAWLACDPADDDLARFLAYLVAALRQVYPHLGEGILEAFHAARPPAPEIAATLVINVLVQIPDRLVLILDDLHSITAPPIYVFLTSLIEHQPPNLSLVLVTRADPALPLARLRGRGQLEEIRQELLSFTLEESEAFLRQVMGASLTQDQLLALESRTEGWAAGLQLAGLSMRAAQDLPAFIDSFSGGHEFIAGYLADEVLALQPEAVKTFLLQTSILERLSAPLCAAVTGAANAPEILESLKEKNLFLVPLDREGTWYRYHALFADLLRNRLHQWMGDGVDELHLRASHWCQENGLSIPAIEHALAGKDVELAAKLIERAVEPVFVSGQLILLLRWLEALPPEVKDSHPLLWIYAGLAPIWRGKSPSLAKPPLAELSPIFAARGLMGEVDTLQALAAMAEGHPLEAARLAKSALDQLSQERAIFRCLAADTLGMTRILLSDSKGAAQAFEQLTEIAAQAGYLMFEIVAISHLAGLHLQQGQLHAAAFDYQRALDLADSKLGRFSPPTAHVMLGLGELALEWNDLDAALRYFNESINLFAKISEVGIPIAYLSIARVKAAQGDWEAGQELLDKARQSAQVSTITRMNIRLVDEVQARFWIARRELGLAEEWAHDKGLFEHPITEIIKTAGLNAAGSEFIQSDYIVLARLYLAQNKVDAALQVLDSLLNAAQALGFMRRVIHLLVLKALAFGQKKETGQAVEILGQALAEAEPEEYLQVFLEEGEPMARLLYRAMEQGYSPGYVKKILSAFSQQGLLANNPEKQPPAEPLFEPLSERERQVLALIAAGLSNREICARLHISLSTVKGHTASIYGKLGVNSRTRAVSEATRLGLLAP
jgi:LuxR family maltose regulon positive regulatory protein